jgi:hypothetical protein
MKNKIIETLKELNNEGAFNLPFITDSEIEKIAERIANPLVINERIARVEGRISGLQYLYQKIDEETDSIIEKQLEKYDKQLDELIQKL